MGKGGVRSQESGVRSQESGVGSRESGVGSRESGVGSRESGVGSRESGVRSQESGVRSQESGVRKTSNATTFVRGANDDYRRLSLARTSSAWVTGTHFENVYRELLARDLANVEPGPRKEIVQLLTCLLKTSFINLPPGGSDV